MPASCRSDERAGQAWRIHSVQLRKQACSSSDMHFCLYSKHACKLLPLPQGLSLVAAVFSHSNLASARRLPEFPRRPIPVSCAAALSSYLAQHVYRLPGTAACATARSCVHDLIRPGSLLWRRPGRCARAAVCIMSLCLSMQQ